MIKSSTWGSFGWSADWRCVDEAYPFRSWSPVRAWNAI